MAKVLVTRDGVSNQLVNGTFLVNRDGVSQQVVAFAGSGSGFLDDIALTPFDGIGTISDTGSGFLPTISLTPVDGSVTFGVNADGFLTDITLTPFDGFADVASDGVGALPDITLTPFDGIANYQVLGEGFLADISLTPFDGTGEEINVTGEGFLATIDLVPFDGFATITSEIHKTIIWQYENSQRITAIVRDKAAILEPQVLLNNFVQYIWDVRTATSQGLDILGRIVGVSRYLSLTPTGYFGFEPDFTPFNDKPFFHGNPINNQVILSNDIFRQVILAKALNNISGSSIPEIERILNLLFGDKGIVDVTITGFAELTYTFHFTPTDVENAIIQAPSLIPQPAGYKIIKAFV